MLRVTGLENECDVNTQNWKYFRSSYYEFIMYYYNKKYL